MIRYYCKTCSRWLTPSVDSTSADLRVLHLHYEKKHDIIEEGKFDFPFYQIKKEYVCKAIEMTLNEFGILWYRKVIDILKTQYHCGISDCVGRPDILKTVLESVYGSSAKAIMQIISEKITGYEDDDDLSEFISIVNQ